MYLKKKLKRIGALVLAIMMTLSGVSFAYAEEMPVVQETPEEQEELMNEQKIETNDDESAPDDDNASDDHNEALLSDEPLMESENEVSLVDPEEPDSTEFEEEVPDEIEENESDIVEQKTVEDEVPSTTDEEESSGAEPIQECETIDILHASETAEPVEMETEDMATDKVETDEVESSEAEADAAQSSMTETIEDQTETESEAVPALGLHQVIDQYGYAYAQTRNEVSVCSDKSLKEILYHADGNRNTWLVTAYYDENVLSVYGLDEDNTVIHGYVKDTSLNDEALAAEMVARLAEDYSCNQRDTDIGPMLLFVISGNWVPEEKENQSVSEDTESISELQDNETTSDEEALPETTEVITEEMTDESSDKVIEADSEMDAEEIQNVISIDIDGNEANPELVELQDEEEITEEELPEEPCMDNEAKEQSASVIEREPQIGDYVIVTTSTRAFSEVDSTAFSDGFPQFLEGSFVKRAVVQIENIETDENGAIWYRISYQYGDVFTDGTRKWNAIGSMYVLAEETDVTDETALTMTDYAYTKEQMQLRNRSGRKLMAASPMNGFSLKKIKVDLGSFTAGQTGLRGSSGKDSDYPQLAKSASHGTIYATPHYLSGYTVYCLEHTYDGPGEGSGSNMTPTGPYKLIDLNAYCNTTAGVGVSKIQFKESTMHAIGWVLRHTYPYMALDRTDANNKVWSRVAGQFAIREVIKQLEGSKYVRDYWNMNDFYSFSGGAPAIYLTYAKWLASNGIARAKITGEITVKNQSMSVSGSNYIGKATLTTDADLIRIPLSAGTLTGNSGGKDSNYYYIKSGDTISVTSTSNRFSIYMESISSADEEAGFLIGVPSASIQKVLVPIEPEPYPMKNKTISFELMFGEITATKKATDGTALKGAVFELLNGSSVIATSATDASGNAKFTSITPGNYTIREKTAPQGYLLGSANSQSVTVTAGVNTTATFTNVPITKKIRIVKTDSVTGKGLPGATFTVTRLSGPDSMNAADVGKVVATITTNGSGVAETGELSYGEYRISETGVPDGYLDSGYSVTQWIK